MELDREHIHVGTKICDSTGKSSEPVYMVTGIAKNGIFTRKVDHFPTGTGHKFIPWEKTHNLEICK